MLTVLRLREMVASLPRWVWGRRVLLQFLTALLIGAIVGRMR